MDHIRDRRLQAEIAAVPIQTGVVSKTLGVTAEAELVISLIKVAGAENEFCLIIAFEARARNDVEHPICPVAHVRAVTSPIDLHVVDVLRINLRGEIGSNVGIGHRDTVYQPAGLMAQSED